MTAGSPPGKEMLWDGRGPIYFMACRLRRVKPYFSYISRLVFFFLAHNTCVLAMHKKPRASSCPLGLPKASLLHFNSASQGLEEG